MCSNIIGEVIGWTVHTRQPSLVDSAAEPCEVVEPAPWPATVARALPGISQAELRSAGTIIHRRLQRIVVAVPCRTGN